MSRLVLQLLMIVLLSKIEVVIMTALKLHMNNNLYVRDPQDTELGRKILEVSIEMIDELGFEKFTFRKLAARIESAEPSIYRYFENKHRLLVYLIAWYWNWLEYRIDFSTQNITEPGEKLKIAIELLAQRKPKDPLFASIDEAALYRIVIAESDKTYLTKQVDDDNKEGLFLGFKSLCKKIAGYVQLINPKYEFPHTLVSTLMQMAHQQLFFSDHLPSLTEIGKTSENKYEMNKRFLTDMVFKTIDASE
ncbi:TetR/AcrR family transcriptional regulator [Fulvivirga ulvae]|uniref:TetR/AcrR family transcriptional regulator n=1 Tax=Fulvivirga ulvae TaxID=2904245 RepID=UPI001F1E1287|nr:TetR/AcrR family transcriptional regulator [Fulvivirga ulvae]UII29819.1 TetR/AcrR family transcriptional regulator [Fulvivirga ulvae]